MSVVACGFTTWIHNHATFSLISISKCSISGCYYLHLSFHLVDLGSWRLHSFLQGIGQLFEKIKQENKANGHMNGDNGLFFTNLYITPVLKNVSLHLEEGKMLAVAGSTGSGKVGQSKGNAHSWLLRLNHASASKLWCEPYCNLKLSPKTCT